MEELNKLWEHHTAHLQDLCQRKENPTGHNSNNSTKFKIGQPVVVKITRQTFEPKYLLEFKVLKIPNDNTLLLIALNGKGRKRNINDVKPCSTTELVENACNSFLSSIKTKCQIATIT